MNLRKIAFISIVALIILVIYNTVFNQKATAYGFKDDSNATAEKVRTLANGINNFAINLYKEIASATNDNIFFSPISIEFALAIAYEGAKGKTKEEMEKVLNLPSDPNIRRPAFARIFNLLNKRGKYEISLANALWVQKNYPILEEYQKVIERYYPADLYRVDFSKSDTLNTINNWVKDRTRGKINKIIDNIDPLTVIVITNAIYFKGKWLHKFDKSKTRLEDFYITPNYTVKVPMMCVKEKFPYTETEDFQVLEMPYKGKEISMIIILPKKIDELREIEEKLNILTLNYILTTLHKTEVKVYFPKFEFKTEYNLKEYLQKVGMVSAFNPNFADFSGINGEGGIYISKVKHKAYIKVDEEGTEAAAATAVGMVGALPEQLVVFRANHPFIFFIIDKRTNIILFMGRVINPKSQSI